MRSSDRPAIHIFAGEKVCIHVMMPAQLSSELASMQSFLMASGVVSTGLNTTSYGTDGFLSRLPEIVLE